MRRQVQYNEETKRWFFTEPKYDSARTFSMGTVIWQLLIDEKKRQDRAREYYGDRYFQVCIDETKSFSASGTPVHLVCVREDGTYIQPRSLQHTNHIAHTELNLPLFDFHTLRHTHATMLLEAGANMIDIQERLGHSKAAMTWRYTHNTEKIRENTQSLLNSIYTF